MAYPGEIEGIEYKKYLERHDLGEEDGPRLTRDEWRKQKMPEEKKDWDSVPVNNAVRNRKTTYRYLK